MTKEGYTSNERIKEESDFLRGNISDLLHDGSITHFPSEEEFLLKFHGITQQDNRDERLIRKKNGQERNWLFMLRLRLPGGRMTPSQWLAAETLSDQFGNGTLKLTTRQAIQIHGVVKQDLKQTMKDIHHAAITTIAASGDATRNVMVSLHPEDSASMKLSSIKPGNSPENWNRRRTPIMKYGWMPNESTRARKKSLCTVPAICRANLKSLLRFPRKMMWMCTPRT